MLFSSDENADRPVPALTGNGELCTTIGRSGFHDTTGDPAFLSTQEFVLAGRRLAGAAHPLISFGRLLATPPGSECAQTIETESATVRSEYFKDEVSIAVSSCVLKHRNAFVSQVTFSNATNSSRRLDLNFEFEISDQPGLTLTGKQSETGIAFEWSSHENLGLITISCLGAACDQHERGCTFVVRETLVPEAAHTFEVTIQFSDRIKYETPFVIESLASELVTSEMDWSHFWSTDKLAIDDDRIARFRNISLYTIACQATPWSIPPTLSKPYWDGGAFHDEYYPFQALLSGGWIEEARRVPYYRLSTLPRAIERARARGALYPWSATEIGEERDPHGHWYTERFHLGQIAACVWNLYDATGDKEELAQLYTVIRETARYFELNMLVRERDGRLTTKACTDFDESAGEIGAGPFTMCAAVYLFRTCARVAGILDRDEVLAERLIRLANDLDLNCNYEIPRGASYHSSVLGPIVPFGLPTEEAQAMEALGKVVNALRVEHGWKPGEHRVFEGTAWMWTAGHIAMSAARLGDKEIAWRVIANGPDSAGQFMSPNEHLNKEGKPIVPWFTTGCGAWVAALQWLMKKGA